MTAWLARNAKEQRGTDMIVQGKRSWLRMVFSLRGSSLSTTWPRILAVTAFAASITWLEKVADIKGYSLTITPFTLIGLAMAIFLGFRNNESYARFWEGRTLWGRLVNVSRSFARQSLTLIVAKSGDDSDEVKAVQHRIVRITIAYVHAFRHHLRDSDPTKELTQYLSDEERAQLLRHRNKPIAILQQLGVVVQEAWQAGHIHDLHVPVLEQSLTEMTGVQGGCERIKGTPIPYTYNVLIHRIVAVYCFALPFGLLESVGVLTPVVVCLISYAFFGLDAIGDDVAQPFEKDENDLPLDAISRNIEINLLQLLGEEDLPEPIQPVDGVLL